MLRWAEPRICAFDIETTKLPLQFPNSEYDQARQRACVLGIGSLIKRYHRHSPPYPG